jgi:hypothetical protein
MNTKKKKEIYELKYIVFDIYILSTGIRFQKIFVVCEYQLRKQFQHNDVCGENSRCVKQ